VRRSTAGGRAAAAAASAVVAAAGSAAAPAPSLKGAWVDPGTSHALRVLTAAERRGACRRGSSPLPECLYGREIEPFLRFDGPAPGQLYALGGRQEEKVLDVVEMFDTWNGRWAECPPMCTRRCGCSAACLPADGARGPLLLAVGGYDERGIVEGLLATSEAFDPMARRWTPLAARLQRPRWGHACAELGGKVYVAGGCSLRRGAPPHEAFMETLASCEVYDPSGGDGQGTWTACASMCVARSGARVVALPDGRHLAAVGGCDDVFGRSQVLSSVELFDALGARRWELLEPSLRVPRSTAAAAAIDDGKILVVGGTPALASAEVYELPRLAALKRLGGEPPGGGGAGAGPAVEDLAAQGLAAEGLAEVLRVGGGSLPCPDMAEGRMGCHAVALDLPRPGSAFPLCTQRCVVVVGGENEEWPSHLGPGRQLGGVMVYDVAAGSWRPSDSFAPMPTPRTAAALCLAPGRVAGHL